jgi:hypothetical protein
LRGILIYQVFKPSGIFVATRTIPIADRALPPYKSHCSSSNLLGGIPVVWRLNILGCGVRVAVIGSGEEESISGLEAVLALSEGVHKPIIRGLLEADLLPFSAYIGVIKRVFSSYSISSTRESNGGR